MDNNYNYQMNNQANGYQQNPYQQNLYQQNMYRQGIGQQNMNQGNGYNQGMYKKKTLDIKGLIITILCLVTSLMASISLFMPIVKTGSEGTSAIDIWSSIGKLIENVGDSDETWYIIYVILGIVAPILIVIFSLIATVLLIIKLASLKFNNSEVGHIRRILKYEMIMSSFSIFYIIIAYLTDNRYYRIINILYDESGLSVGWYLPVIMCICTIVVAAIIEYAFNVKDKKFDSKYTVNGIIAIVTVIFSSIMYISFAFSQIVLTEGGYRQLKVGFSYYVMIFASGMSDIDSYSSDEYGMMLVSAVVFIIAIVMVAILSARILKKSLAGLQNGKFSGTMSIVTGIVGIVLYIGQLIVCKIGAAEIDDDIEVKIGAAGYMYIIFGALLIVIGIVQLCVRNYLNSKENYASHPLLNGNGMSQQNNMPQNGYRPY